MVFVEAEATESIVSVLPEEERTLLGVSQLRQVWRSTSWCTPKNMTWVGRDVWENADGKEILLDKF